jgi:hypothetical protein
MDIAILAAVAVFLLFVALVTVGAMGRFLVLALTGARPRWRTPAETAPAPTLKDPVFGVLTHDSRAKLWTGRLAGAGSQEIAIGVSAPAAGPDDRQRDFFRKLESQIPDLARRAGNFSPLKNLLRAEAGNWTPAAGAEFELHAVTVEDASLPQRWEAEFIRSDADDFLVYCVCFVGMDIQSIRAED